MDIKCQNCGSTITVKYLTKGEIAKCKNCGADNIVPDDPSYYNKGKYKHEITPGSMNPPNYRHQEAPNDTSNESKDNHEEEYDILVPIAYSCIGCSLLGLYLIMRYDLIGMPKILMPVFQSDTILWFIKLISGISIASVAIILFIIHLSRSRKTILGMGFDTVKSKPMYYRPLLYSICIILVIEIVLRVINVFL